jgi:Virulence factor membrane-bound polymerase, C-terminal/O-Antigen ligase
VFFVVLAFADWRDRKKVRAIFFLSLPVMYLAWYLIFIQLDSAGWLPYYGTQRAISVDALSSQNNSDRLEIWKVAMQLVHNHPWFGIGYGQLPYYSAVEVLGWNFYLILDYTHNFFLQWALDFGLPVALLLLFLLLMMAWHLRALLKHSDGRILIALLMFPVLHEVVEFPLHYPTFLMPWCFLLGFLLASRFVSTRPAEETPALAESRPLIRMKNVSAAIISFVLAVLAIYAIYDSAKPGQLFQSPNAAVPYASIELAYSTIAFEHIADFAVIQTVPTTTGTAAQIHRLAAKVAKVRFDINVATIYMQASALDGRMCVAKSIAYRLANADTKSKDRLFVVLSKRTEPEFRELEAFAKNPYAVDWRPERIGNC